MGRIRTIKPETFADERIGTLPERAFIACVWAVTEADDAGRLRWSPAHVRSGAWKYRDVSLAEAAEHMGAVERAEFVVAYENHGQRYAYIRTWFKHQQLDATHVRPKSPWCPPPSVADCASHAEYEAGVRTFLARIAECAQNEKKADKRAALVARHDALSAIMMPCTVLPTCVARETHVGPKCVPGPGPGPGPGPIDPIPPNPPAGGESSPSEPAGPEPEPSKRTRSSLSAADRSAADEVRALWIAAGLPDAHGDLPDATARKLARHRTAHPDDAWWRDEVLRRVVALRRTDTWSGLTLRRLAGDCSQQMGGGPLCEAIADGMYDRLIPGVAARPSTPTQPRRNLTREEWHAV